MEMKRVCPQSLLACLLNRDRRAPTPGQKTLSTAPACPAWSLTPAAAHASAGCLTDGVEHRCMDITKHARVRVRVHSSASGHTPCALSMHSYAQLLLKRHKHAIACFVIKMRKQAHVLKRPPFDAQVPTCQVVRDVICRHNHVAT